MRLRRRAWPHPGSSNYPSVKISRPRIALVNAMMTKDIAIPAHKAVSPGNFTAVRYKRSPEPWWYLSWLELGEVANRAGVPMELLLDEEHYAGRSTAYRGRGLCLPRILCVAYRRGYRDLVDLALDTHGAKSLSEMPYYSNKDERFWRRLVGRILIQDTPVTRSKEMLPMIMQHLGIDWSHLVVGSIRFGVKRTNIHNTMAVLLSRLSSADVATLAGVAHMLAVTQPQGVEEALEGFKEIWKIRESFES
ncbi:MAG: hypothetical protein ACUVRO_11080 [Armatimonadota bacterium]